MPSVRLGVSPISKTESDSKLYTSDAGVPGVHWASNSMMPSWDLPTPISSSAQIIPMLTSPRILPFLILKESPSVGCRVVPTVATITRKPWRAFAAPQTMGRGSASPMFTSQTCKRSALGCWAQAVISPTTSPLNPPGMLSTVSTPSTSNPVAVSTAAASSAEVVTGSRSLSH